MPPMSTLTHTILPTVVRAVSPDKQQEFIQYLVTKWESRWQSQLTENVMEDENGKSWKALPHKDAFTLMDEWFPEAIREMFVEEFVEELIAIEKREQTSTMWDIIQRKIIAIYDYIHSQKTNGSIATKMIECFKKLPSNNVYGIADGLEVGFFLNKVLLMQSHEQVSEYIETLEKTGYYTDTLNAVLDELISANNIAI